MEDNTTQAVSVETLEKLREFDPGKVRFERDGIKLTLIDEQSQLFSEVTILRPFPLSDPEHNLIVHHKEGWEIGMIADLSQLDRKSREIVQQELRRRYLTPKIQRVLSIREAFGYLEWDVETDRGICRFTTRRLQENVQRPGPNRYLISDVEGNRYEINDLVAMDAKSQSLLMQRL